MARPRSADARVGCPTAPPLARGMRLSRPLTNFRAASGSIVKSRARSIRTAGDVLNPVNAVDQDGKSSLIRAAYAGDAAEVAALLEKGAALALADHGGMTALIWASNKGRADCVKLLLDAGADPKVADSPGRTAWFYADMRDFDEIKKMLEAKGGGAPAGAA